MPTLKEGLAELLDIARSKPALERGAFEEMLLEINALNNKLHRLDQIKHKVEPDKQFKALIKLIDEQPSITSWLEFASSRYMFVFELGLSSVKELKKVVENEFNGDSCKFYAALLSRQLEIISQELLKLMDVVSKNIELLGEKNN
jgi:hypothetical protein